MKTRLHRFVLLFYTLILLSAGALVSLKAAASLVLAQELGVALPLEVGTTVANGSIISYNQSQYQLSSEPYDKSMIGVVTTAPAIELRTSDENIPGQYALAKEGLVTVRVNTENGPIKAKDVITASSTPGVAMKATKTGFILGIAQADYSGNDEGAIPVLLTIKFAFAHDSPASEKIGVRLLDVLKLSGISLVDDPIQTLRYVLSTAVILMSLVVAFFTAGKVARGGVEAVGRNPLASKEITLSVIMNILFSVGIVGLGVLAAYVIGTLGT